MDGNMLGIIKIIDIYVEIYIVEMIWGLLIEFAWLVEFDTM